MESGFEGRVKAASLPSSLGNLLSSVGQFLLPGLVWVLAPCPGFAVAAKAGALMGSEMMRKMQIIIFSIKLALYHFE